MTEVLFYVLSDGDDDVVRFTCRLADKIHEQRRKLYLHAASAAMAQQLDNDLWTFRQGSFIPHLLVDRLEGPGDPTPVAIGTADNPPTGFDDVLINLADEVPGFFSRFQRTVEIVTPTTRAAARQRYKFYQDRGYPMETHKVS